MICPHGSSVLLPHYTQPNYQTILICPSSFQMDDLSPEKIRPKPSNEGFSRIYVTVYVLCNQSLETQKTVLQCTIAGRRTKGADEKSLVFVHQHGGDDVT